MTDTSESLVGDYWLDVVAEVWQMELSRLPRRGHEAWVGVRDEDHQRLVAFLRKAGLPE